MRYLKFTLMALFVTIAASAQDLEKTEVPANFTDGLLEVYPNATNIQWQRTGTDYKVKFDNENLEQEIWFNKDGDTVMKQLEVTKLALPQELATAIKRDYPDYTIGKVHSNFKDGVTAYEVELEKDGTNKLKVSYSVAGKVLQESQN